MISLAAADWLPFAFLILMGVSLLAYVILDGFDLGVGMLLAHTDDEGKDTMIASIGPFWDANETWLVLATGILLVAYPMAQGVVFAALYIPLTLMAVGLMLRGVAFDFRGKVPAERKHRWNQIFVAGSWLASLTQGYMLGLYIMGLHNTPMAHGFAVLTAICLAAAYRLIGAAWLIHKTHGALQERAIQWARTNLTLAALGLLAISLVTPLINQRVFDAWFSLPNLLLLAPIPLLTGVLVIGLGLALRKVAFTDPRYAWLPFLATVAIFVLSFHGLAFSFYPYIVPDTMTIWQAAAAPDSLMMIFIGTMIQLPVLLGCTLFVHKVFGGKATALSYY